MLPSAKQQQRKFFCLPPPNDNFNHEKNAFFRYSPSVSYRDRKTRGNVVATFGREKLRNTATFKTALGRKIEMRLWGEQDGWLSTETRYMYDVLGRKSAVLNGITNWLGEALKEKYFAKDCAFVPFEKISLVRFEPFF